MRSSSSTRASRSTPSIFFDISASWRSRSACTRVSTSALDNSVSSASAFAAVARVAWALSRAVFSAARPAAFNWAPVFCAAASLDDAALLCPELSDSSLGDGELDSASARFAVARSARRGRFRRSRSRPRSPSLRCSLLRRRSWWWRRPGARLLGLRRRGPRTFRRLCGLRLTLTRRAAPPLRARLPLSALGLRRRRLTPPGLGLRRPSSWLSQRRLSRSRKSSKKPASCRPGSNMPRPSFWQNSRHR
mmetsp:Transcript_99667/g.282035  ORF Transcript_99667/g.282035 Transcript_99667/m.282035 type:complete len:248 (-) Transcript_99667:726-1469(-)